MKCVGVKSEYRLYYDLKHNEFLLMTPKFHFTRCFGHCNNREIADWAEQLSWKVRKEIEEGRTFKEC